MIAFNIRSSSSLVLSLETGRSAIHLSTDTHFKKDVDSQLCSNQVLTAPKSLSPGQTIDSPINGNMDVSFSIRGASKSFSPHMQRDAAVREGRLVEAVSVAASEASSSSRCRL